MGLTTSQRDNCKRRFYRIINHFLPASEINSSARSRNYSPPRLISLTYKYALSDEARDNFLRAFFLSVNLPILTGDTEQDDSDLDGDLDGDPETLRTSVFGFADYLLDNFFLPLRASTKKTPQPSPVFHSAIERVQGGPQTFASTTERLSALRGACLVRDHHRCVISHNFDSDEGLARMEKAGMTNALDDDGNLLYQGFRPSRLEVAHIIPYSLMKADASSELSPSKKAALAILNMFDTGVIHLIDSGDIDRPRNALTLSQEYHAWFGQFRVFFEPVSDSQPHTYRIDTTLPPVFIPDLPLTRTLYLSENRTIDPPSPRLLAVHRAIAHILHLSAAAEYIDKLLRDMEGQGVCAADGSTELDRLLKLGLRGWSIST